MSLLSFNAVDVCSISCCEIVYHIVHFPFGDTVAICNLGVGLGLKEHDVSHVASACLCLMVPSVLT